jgi:hypothetical protein
MSESRPSTTLAALLALLVVSLLFGPSLSDVTDLGWFLAGALRS